MLKTIDCPRELRTFNSLFFEFQYRHDAYVVFDDLLTIFICCLARETEEKLYFETIKRYSKKELNIFAKMYAELFILYQKAKEENDWIDPLGDYYEVLSSSSKKSRFGQFFSPKNLCDMMAQMIITPNEWGKNILEPASGSGRMVLAANQIANGNYFIAKDLDGLCCKMTAINMCLHEIRGEVHHTNALSSQTPFLSYSINYKFYSHRTPIILLKRYS